jgi:hypothetical protein
MLHGSTIRHYTILGSGRRVTLLLLLSGIPTEPTHHNQALRILWSMDQTQAGTNLMHPCMEL